MNNMYDFAFNSMYNQNFDCHQMVEITEGLYIGSISNFTKAIEDSHTFDVIVPLDYLPGKLWKEMNPETTEVLYFPIEDYGFLPIKHLSLLAHQIIDRLEQSKTVFIFCVGGHGRTGYVASAVLALKGYPNPVEFIRENYCPLAVETLKQIKSLLNFMNYEGLNTEVLCKYHQEEKKRILKEKELRTKYLSNLLPKK